MSSGLKEILHEVYLKERKLNLLYDALAALDGLEPGDSGFFVSAQDDQQGDLELLREINAKYGNPQVDAGILERLGEGLLQLKSGRKDFKDLLRQVLGYESELVEQYKESLRYLSADDRSRRQINRILTVKLVHKRDLLDRLNRL
jgi:hypothetical protein